MSLPDYSTQAPGVRQVVEVGYEDIIWSYDSNPTIKPGCFFGNKKAWQTKVEPMPAYSHDRKQVEALLAHCGEIAPLCNPVTITILKLIDARHTNGWAQQQWDNGCYTPDDCQCDVVYKGSDGKDTTRRRNWDGIIVLSGKTTEIHPAIARYVVAHEYAHILEDALEILRPDRHLLKDWGKARRIPEANWNLPYGPTTHHLMPSEIFANDFRYFVAEQELEWWPHGEVVAPLGAYGTVRGMQWWEKAIEDLNVAYKSAVTIEA